MLFMWCASAHRSFCPWPDASLMPTFYCFVQIYGYILLSADLFLFESHAEILFQPLVFHAAHICASVSFDFLNNLLYQV
jgi:hypothetical protein